MLDLVLTAGPVFGIMLSPLLLPVIGSVVGRLIDPFRSAPEPGVHERLAARRAAEAAGRHAAPAAVEVPQAA